MSDDTLVRVEGVSKKFCRSLKRSLWYGIKDTAGDLAGRRESIAELRPEEFWAVDDVSFELKRGECLGLIGRNGAGKTTLLKMLNGLIKPDKGRIEMRGRVGALIALGAGFNPILTGRENVYVNGSVLGLTKREIDGKFDEIVDFAEIGEFIDSPVQSYSSGMQVRLGFAVATAMNPEVLILDEVLAVGDANFRRKCAFRLGKVLEKSAVILVSHQTHSIMRICNAAVLLQQGRMVCSGRPDEVMSAYGTLELPPGQPREFVLDDKVLGVQIVEASDEVHHGGHLAIRLRLEISEAVRCDNAFLNICDPSDNVQAQVMLENHVVTLERGTSELSISAGPIFLAQGQFYGTIILWTASGKRPLVLLGRAFSFRNTGPTSLGTHYYPPGRITQSPTYGRPWGLSKSVARLNP